MYFLSVESAAAHPVADHEAGEEIAPGVVIERRTVLRLGLLALGGMALPSIGCQSAPPPAAQKPAALGFDQMMALLRPKARELVQAQVPDEEAYLRQVAALMTRLAPPQDVALRGPVTFASMFDERPLVVYQIKMAPGARIALHDHRHYNGVLMGVAGACRCRYFDIVPPAGAAAWSTPDGAPPKEMDFRIRQSADCVVGPGIAGQLSRVRNNLHELEAGPDGARLLDVFTFFRPDGSSHWLEWRQRKPDADGLYAVRWR